MPASFVALWLVVCLQGGTDCQAERIREAEIQRYGTVSNPIALEGIPRSECIARGQFYAERWLSRHPGYELRAWVCSTREPPVRNEA